MPLRTDSATILLVERDAVLAEVLTRALAREGLTILHAVDGAEALSLAEEHEPQLVLLDFFTRDGTPLELPETLRTRFAGLQVIAIADDPLCGQQDPSRVSWFAEVLTKSFDLRGLRQAVDRSLSLAADATALAASLRRTNDRKTGELGARGDQRGQETRRTEASISLSLGPLSLTNFGELPMSFLRSKFVKAAGIVVISLAAVAGFAMAMGTVPMPWQPEQKAEAQPAKPALLGVELVKGQPHTLAVPEEVRKALGIRKGHADLIVAAWRPTKGFLLVMPGSTALDPTRMHRIRARFAPSPSSAEVVQIALVPEDRAQSGKLETVFREIRSGDRVQKGDLLAVFYSVDVGNKKNDLIDAIYQLKLDEEILKKAEAKAEAVPEVLMLTYRRAVQGDINTMNRAVSTLKTWGISEKDIDAVLKEAEEVKKRDGKHDKAKDELWARVEIRAPDDGVIIERNVSLHEIVVDNTTNLFQIAKVDRLSVFANVPEDDLPALQALPTAERRWTVRTVGSPPVQGFISDIGYLIDPNQHTAVVKGYIDNPGEVLRAGQFISATVQLPPPEDVVEVPIDAVVDDGQQSVVFVQSDPKKHPDYFTIRRVVLMQRFDRTAFVRSKPFAKGEQRTAEEEELGVLPKEALGRGDRILQTGVGELKAALLDKESEPGNERKEEKKP